MEGQVLSVTESLQRANHPGERPGGHRQAKRHVKEDVHYPVYDKGQVALGSFCNRNTKERVLEIHSATPRTCDNSSSNIPDRLHLESRNNEELVEAMEVYDQSQGAALLPHKKETGEEERTRLDDLYNAPGKKVGEEPPDGRQLRLAAGRPTRRHQSERRRGVKPEPETRGHDVRRHRISQRPPRT